MVIMIYLALALDFTLGSEIYPSVYLLLDLLVLSVFGIISVDVLHPILCLQVYLAFHWKQHFACRHALVWCGWWPGEASGTARACRFVRWCAPAVRADTAHTRSAHCASAWPHRAQHMLAPHTRGCMQTAAAHTAPAARLQLPRTPCGCEHRGVPRLGGIGVCGVGRRAAALVLCPRPEC